MKQFYLLVSFFFATPLLIFGQCETCKEALNKDVLKYSTNDYIVAKYAENINEHEYEELKKDFHHDGSVPIPWLGGIVKGSFDYKDFKTKLHDYVLRLESTYEGSFKTDYTFISTNPIAYSSFDKCMETCNLGFGIHIYKIGDYENFGQYKIRYIPAPRESDSIFCEIIINTDDSTITQNSIIYKNGNATYTYPRKYSKNISKSLISVNASQTRGGGVSYSDNFQSEYIKPAGIKVNSLNYSYVVTVSKNEIGESIKNCLLPVIPVHGEDRRYGGRKLVSIGMIDRSATNFSKNTSNLAYTSTANNCQAGEIGKSCDGKWAGYFHVIQVTASDSYTFRNPLTSNQLKLEGPMRDWNMGQRCPQNDKILLDKADIKQMRVWLYQDVTAHLEMTSYKDSTIDETTFARVDDLGKISFEIPTNKLNKYSIEIKLSNGNVINITPENINEKAYLNIIGDNTMFTLKNINID